MTRNTRLGEERENVRNSSLTAGLLCNLGGGKHPSVGILHWVVCTLTPFSDQYHYSSLLKRGSVPYLKGQWHKIFLGQKILPGPLMNRLQTVFLNFSISRRQRQGDIRWQILTTTNYLKRVNQANKVLRCTIIPNSNIFNIQKQGYLRPHFRVWVVVD